MKIHMDLPWGGTLDVEREPMSYDRFELLCLLIGVLGVVALVVYLFINTIK